MSEDPVAIAAPGGKKKRMLVMMMAGLVLAAGGGGGGFWYWQRAKTAPHAPAAPKNLEIKARFFAPMEPFTVNLRTTGVERFLQIGVVFEVSGSEVSEAVTANMPLLRGKVLLLLSDKTAEDLAGAEGKMRLAAELVAVARYALQAAPGLGKTLPEKAVTDAHFSSLIIQ